MAIVLMLEPLSAADELQEYADDVREVALLHGGIAPCIEVLTGDSAALLKTAIKFVNMPAEFQFRAYFEDWSREKLLAELYPVAYVVRVTTEDGEVLL